MERERITEVAIKYPDGVASLPRPYRHGHIMRDYYEDTGKQTGGDCEQGFVTSIGRFVDREEAARIAQAAGQVGKLISPPELFSEDLW